MITLIHINNVVSGSDNIILRWVIVEASITRGTSIDHMTFLEGN